MNPKPDPTAEAFRSAFDHIVGATVETPSWDELSTTTETAEQTTKKVRVWWQQPAVVAGGAALVTLAAAIPLILLGGPGNGETAVSDPVDPTPTLASETQRFDPRDPGRPIVPMDVTSQLECLPLDPVGWTHSEPFPFLDEPWAAQLATSADVAVAMGYDLDIDGASSDDVLVYWSDDGLNWQLAEGFLYNEYLSRSRPQLAGSDRGFVIVGTPEPFPVVEGEYEPVEPVVAFSPDGRIWKRVDPDALPIPRVLGVTDVTAGSGGFIVRGSTDSASGDFVWFSPDGSTWTPSELPDLAFGPAIIATDSGWAALGIAHANLERPAGARSYDDYMDLPAQVWTSSDGSHWSLVETSNPPLAIVAAGYMGTPPLAVYGDRWVAAPEFYEHGNPSVWVTADQGRTWNEHLLGGEFAAFEHTSWDMEVTPAGLLITGRHDLGRDQAYVLHYSANGATWQHCGTTPPITPGNVASSAFTEMAMLGETLILYDSDTGIFHSWNDPVPAP